MSNDKNAPAAAPVSNFIRHIIEADLAAGSIISVGPAIFVVCIDGKPASFDPKKALSQGAKPAAATTVKGAETGG